MSNSTRKTRRANRFTRPTTPIPVETNAEVAAAYEDEWTGSREIGHPALDALSTAFPIAHASERLALAREIETTPTEEMVPISSVFDCARAARDVGFRRGFVWGLVSAGSVSLLVASVLYWASWSVLP